MPQLENPKHEQFVYEIVNRGQTIRDACIAIGENPDGDGIGAGCGRLYDDPLIQGRIKEIFEKRRSLRPLEAVKDWLDSLQHQQVGRPSATSETGEEYQEFTVYRSCRPKDVRYIEAEAANDIKQRLMDYFNSREGSIYWRVRFDYEVCESCQVVKYDDSGPHVDFVTGKKCIKDYDWTLIRARCRVLKSAKAPVVEDFSPVKLRIVS